MVEQNAVRRVVIMGAAGRDFHNFNMVYRDNPSYDVIAFTATQIPGIAGRRYPPALAGERYPQGLPIVDEAELDRLCREDSIDEVAFSYSDVTHATVMHAASRALAGGADFVLLGPRRTMIEAKVPVIAVSAVRTGCGKSQVGRWLSAYLRDKGLSAAVIRHPMPYGDLERQAVQRFASPADLAAADCTIEEREEYEPHIAAGHPIFAGVDYARIVELAQTQDQLILWEGGNNDYPFLRPDLHIVLADALRPEQETSHHPGEAVLRMADVAVIAKSCTATREQVQKVAAAIAGIRPELPVIKGASPVTLDNPSAIEGRRVLVVEDGPTITHGGMGYGAGFVAVRDLAAEIVDPRVCAASEITEVFQRYPHIGPVLPAVGYGEVQRRALERTIDQSDAEVVVAATPIDLGALLKIDKPIVRARYAYADVGEPRLSIFVDAFLDRTGLAAQAG
jgi:predicted GTPase